MLNDKCKFYKAIVKLEKKKNETIHQEHIQV